MLKTILMNVKKNLQFNRTKPMEIRDIHCNIFFSEADVHTIHIINIPTFEIHDLEIKYF